MLADQPGDALAQTERALALTRERGERGLEAWALRLLGEVASRRETPDLETAAGHYRQAIVLADDLGLHPLAACCHGGLGKLYRRMGKGAEAKAHLATAATMFRQTGTRFWLEQAEAELGSLA